MGQKSTLAAYITAGKRKRRDLVLSTVHRYATKSSRRPVPNAVCNTFVRGLLRSWIRHATTGKAPHWVSISGV
jgi:hypothetical protein